MFTKEKMTVFLPDINRNKKVRQDYRQFRFTGKEWGICAVQGSLTAVLFAWFFYKNLIFVFPLLPILPVWMKRQAAIKKKERQQNLANQFRDFILAAAGSLGAGYSIENAFLDAGREILALYGRDSDMARETEWMRQGMHNRIPLEQLLEDFGKRSGVEEIEDFTVIFSIAKRSGGNLNRIIRRTAALTEEKIELKKEIALQLSARRYEQSIMNMVPFGIIAYMQATAGSFFHLLYHNAAGIAVMTACLGLYLAAFFMAEKINQIEI